MGQKRHSEALGTFLGGILAVRRRVGLVTRSLNCWSAAPARMATVWLSSIYLAGYSLLFSLGAHQLQGHHVLKGPSH